MISSVHHRDAHDNIGYCGAVQQIQLSALHTALQVHDRCIGTPCKCMHPTGTITTVCFKNTRQNDKDIFWWIFGHVSLLKFVKDVEDDNHYSVLQINIISSVKYCD